MTSHKGGVGHSNFQCWYHNMVSLPLSVHVLELERIVIQSIREIESMHWNSKTLNLKSIKLKGIRTLKLLLVSPMGFNKDFPLDLYLYFAFLPANTI